MHCLLIQHRLFQAYFVQQDSSMINFFIETVASIANDVAIKSKWGVFPLEILRLFAPSKKKRNNVSCAVEEA